MPYFYEHTNGSIHMKPDIVVDMGGGPSEYFSGPFCKNWWHDKYAKTPEEAMRNISQKDIDDEENINE